MHAACVPDIRPTPAHQDLRFWRLGDVGWAAIEWRCAPGSLVGKFLWPEGGGLTKWGPRDAHHGALCHSRSATLLPRIAIDGEVPYMTGFPVASRGIFHDTVDSLPVRRAHRGRRREALTQPRTGPAGAVGYAGPVAWYSTSARHCCPVCSSHPLQTWRMRLLHGLDTRSLPRCGHVAVPGTPTGIAELVASMPPAQKESL